MNDVQTLVQVLIKNVFAGCNQEFGTSGREELRLTCLPVGEIYLYLCYLYHFAL